MTDKLSIRLKNYELVIDRIRMIAKKYDPDSPAIKRALTRAALIIINQAKLNIRRHGLIDTGRLINSLRYEFYRPDPETAGIRIGSFGVPYAAFWEFGFHGNVPVRSHNRLITQAFGRPLRKSVIARVKAHIRRVDQEGKPYLRPAYYLHRERILAIIEEGILEG